MPASEETSSTLAIINPPWGPPFTEPPGASPCGDQGPAVFITRTNVYTGNTRRRTYHDWVHSWIRCSPGSRHPRKQVLAFTKGAPWCLQRTLGTTTQVSVSRRPRLASSRAGGDSSDKGQTVYVCENTCDTPHTHTAGQENIKAPHVRS